MIPVIALFLLAQTPRFDNAKLETRALQAPLGTELARIQGPAWVGYSVPAHGGRVGNDGCWCDSDTVSVLYRLMQGKVEKVRLASLNCRFDAGGLPVTWLTGVAPKDSIAFLETQGEKGVTAIALHDDEAAVPALIRLSKTSPDGKTRGQALFWMAQRAGDKIAQHITDAIDNDPDTDVKKKAVFALSLMPKDEGVPKLIEVAKNNRNAAVRKQAVFWLGQSKDPRAFAFIEDVLTH